MIDIPLKNVNGDWIRYRSDEILFFEGNHDKTKVYTVDGAVHAILKTQKSLFGVLKNDFIRVHRSFYINSHFFIKIIDDYVFLESGHLVPYTKSYEKNLLKVLRN